MRESHRIVKYSIILIEIINPVVKIWDNHIPCFKGLQIIVQLVVTALFEIVTDKVST